MMTTSTMLVLAFKKKTSEFFTFLLINFNCGPVEVVDQKMVWWLSLSESHMRAGVFINTLCGFNNTAFGHMAEFPAVAPVTPLFAYCCIPLFSFTCIPISSLELVSILGMNSPSPPTSHHHQSLANLFFSVIFFIFFSLTDSPCFSTLFNFL